MLVTASTRAELKTMNILWQQKANHSSIPQTQLLPPSLITPPCNLTCTYIACNLTSHFPLKSYVARPISTEYPTLQLQYSSCIPSAHSHYLNIVTKSLSFSTGSPWISKPVSGHQRRSMYTDLSALPGVDDPEVAEALNILVANPWLEIEHDVATKMERVLATSR